MSSKQFHSPKYHSSWALVIGINKYEHCSPLSHACNDAKAVAEVLRGKFAFPDGSVELLIDSQATKSEILRAFLRHADASTADPDDRGLIFFAGHGHTAQSQRGEVGYLVPSDGNSDDLSTLIRWDELTRNAELLPAKHLFFIMDACYGGLAVTRHLHPGSRRFLADMLARFSRQVLTAGKADQEVADGDGPRAGNSLFTGHLLDALDGAAATKDGLITANGVMAYVYDRVAKDQYSAQTPHYGFIDGDGDFIFSKVPDDLLTDDGTGGKDVMIDVPAGLIDQNEELISERQEDGLKEYLSEQRYRIRLDDLVNSRVRSTTERLRDEKLSASLDPGKVIEEFPKRIAAYEDAVRPIQSTAILLGKWATSDQFATVANMYARLADVNASPTGGLTVLLSMRWYPISVLMYTGGIAAVSAGNYEALEAMSVTKVTSPRAATSEPVSLIVAVVEAMLDVQRTEIWKSFPGHERNYTPQSEYLFKALQPILEDSLFLGASYEKMFDNYEVLRALMFADVHPRANQFWGPVGRFGWKYSSRFAESNPFSTLCAEAAAKKDQWPPLKAGLFRGSYDRFYEIATGFENQILKKLSWF